MAKKPDPEAQREALKKAAEEWNKKTQAQKKADRRWSPKKQ
jgi:hypothetical protein